MAKFNVGDIVKCDSRNYSTVKIGNLVKIIKINFINKPYPFSYSEARRREHIVGIIQDGPFKGNKIGSSSHGFDADNFIFVEKSMSKEEVMAIKYWAVSQNGNNRIGAATEEELNQKISIELTKSPTNKYDVFEYSFTAVLPKQDFVKETRNFDVV